MSLGPAPEALQVFSYFLKSFSGFFSKNGGKSWVLTQPLLPRQDQVFFSVIPDTHFSEPHGSRNSTPAAGNPPPR